MKTYNIAVIPGDGTGPEVIGEGLKVLKAAAKKFKFGLKTKVFPFGGKHYLETGRLVDEADEAELRKFDAIYLGAIGLSGAGAKNVAPGILEKNILLKLRFDFDQYINLRPVKLYPGVASPIAGVSPETMDYVVVRENTGGVYTGMGGIMMKGTPNEIASQEWVYNRFQVDRCLRYAFELAKKRHTKKSPFRGLSAEAKAAGKTARLTLCGKTNVLTNVFGLWERAAKEMAKEYPSVELAYRHVDAICLLMVQDPGQFDVIVTDNMFGDIITDLGAACQGGLGVAAGGNLNPDKGGVSMYEPIGGTAPDWTGRNGINPIAAIGAAALMIGNLGETKAAAAIEAAIAKTTPKMKTQLAGQMGWTTTQVGDLVAKSL